MWRGQCRNTEAAAAASRVSETTVSLAGATMRTHRSDEVPVHRCRQNNVIYGKEQKKSRIETASVGLLRIRRKRILTVAEARSVLIEVRYKSPPRLNTSLLQAVLPMESCCDPCLIIVCILVQHVEDTNLGVLRIYRSNSYGVKLLTSTTAGATSPPLLWSVRRKSRCDAVR